LADGLAHRWGLAIAGEELRHGFNSVVLSTFQGDRPLALKLTWPPGRAQGEAGALAIWQGRGAVELVSVDASRGALLLEHLDAARSLTALSVIEAAAVAGTLIRTLAIEAPAATFPALQDTADELATTISARQRSLHDPVPADWVTLAAGLAASLAQDPQRMMVHTDLHYGNVLATQRPEQPWAAIDPVAASGAPERSVAELLWTRADELPDSQAITGLLGVIVENGHLDRAKAVAWGFVRSIDYWLWGLQNGLTVDPVRCERIAAALAPEAKLVNA
jgi:streptomycin 6-kinase